MKILILEDANSRIQTFIKHYGKKHDLYFFDNITDAKDALNLLGPFDVIFLDHDLDDRVYVNSNEANTGYQLAKWMQENNISAEEIIIHSMNPVGADNIKAVLPQAKIIPFINLF